MTCTELVKHSASFGRKVTTRRFDDLSARDLVLGWARRAGEARDPFEGFIYLWIAFNGWAACVTGLEKDRDIIDAVSLNQDLARRFGDLVSRSSKTASHARAFATLWPIFRASELNRRGIGVTAARRTDQVRQIVAAGAPAAAAAPSCWSRHSTAGERPPVDWPHTLAAVYCVRNNLFHGNKASDSETDSTIVSTAFNTLQAFLQEARVFTSGAS